MGRLDPAPEFVERQEAAFRCEEELAGEIPCTGDVAAARTAATRAGVLAGIAGVDQLKVGLSQPRSELCRSEPQFGTNPGREAGTGRVDRAGFDRPTLVDPAVPAPLEHADGIVTMVVQGPPEPRSKLASGVIDGNDVSLVANSPHGHGLGESSRRGDLGGNRIVRVDDIPGPVDVDGSRDVSGHDILPAHPGNRRAPRRARLAG